MNKIANELIKIAKGLIGHNRFKWNRSMFKDKDAREYIPDKDVDAVFYLREMTDETGKTKYYGTAFVGKQNKPLWNYYFRNERDRDKEIEKTVDNRRAIIEYKRKQREERNKFSHSLKVGDILYTSWGYDQTNVDYYQVIKLPSAKMVVIREIASKRKGDDYVVPAKNKFVGPPMRKKVGHGDTIKINSFAWAHKWEGKPNYETFGMGH